jgi:hypothetical protein
VASIHALSGGTEKEMKGAEDGLARAGAESLVAAFNALDPARHSLGCLYLLCVPGSAALGRG